MTRRILSHISGHCRVVIRSFCALSTGSKEAWPFGSGPVTGHCRSTPY